MFLAKLPMPGARPPSCRPVASNQYRRFAFLAISIRLATMVVATSLAVWYTNASSSSEEAARGGPSEVQGCLRNRYGVSDLSQIMSIERFSSCTHELWLKGPCSLYLRIPAVFFSQTAWPSAYMQFIPSFP